MLTLAALLFGIIMASAICSTIEAAILSLPVVRARILVEQKRLNARDVLYLKENIGITVATIVLISNAISVAGSIFFGEQVRNRFGHDALGWAATIMTLGIIIAGEIIPKRVGEHYKIPVSLIMAKPLKWLVWLCKPLLSVILRIADPWMHESHSLQKVTEEEIKMMLRLGRDAGSVEMDEEVLCNRVFKLNDLRAFQLMKSLEEIHAIPAGKTLGEIREDIINARFSRIGVYDKNPGDLVGMVQQRILLREIARGNEQVKVKDFMTKPIFVNWFTKADALLEKFQAYNQHLFVVQDTHGKAVGIVTMEDVLEQLFGAIYDEKDIHHKTQVKIPSRLVEPNRPGEPTR